MIDHQRRLFLGAGVGGVSLLFDPAFAGCRISGNPSVGACHSGCTTLDATYRCQDDVLFPSSDKIARGVVAGAVLGGVIAFALGDVSIVAGVLAGGVVGGVAAGVLDYSKYSLTRAYGDYGKAFDNMSLDKEDDEYRLNGYVADQYAEQLVARIEPAARDIQTAAARGVSNAGVAQSDAWKEIKKTETAIRQVRKSAASFKQTPVVYQQALKQIGAPAGRRAIPAPSPIILDKSANTVERALRAIKLFSEAAHFAGYSPG